MSELKILVQKSWCHPEFGGTKIENREFEMGDFNRAKNLYDLWSKEDCYVHHTIIQIIHKQETGE